MSDRIQKIVSELPDLERVTEVGDLAARRLARGDAAFVADLGIALSGRYGASAAGIWQYRSVFDRLLRLVALTPGPGHVEQAVRLVSAAARTDRRLPRRAASMLAAARPPGELNGLYAGGGSSAGASEELRACLLHELVLRGVAIAQWPAIEAWATSGHWRRHPLARLPLERTVMEEEPPLPSYSENGSSFPMPYEPPGGPRVTSGSTADLPGVTDTTTEEFSRAAAAAVINWSEESNGHIETRRYEPARPVGADRLPALLPTLGLECLDGAGAGRRLALCSGPPGHAWRVLFAAASCGGAYNSGVYGAYGRLAAWRSVAALSGAAADAPVGEVEQHALACDWYDFGGATRWFSRVAWDIGLVCVAPDARRVTVLAATDTD
ncbi:DUF6183 family protein [Streptomyces sp. enrichment culture]|uniref:DUF6183 family protein n=1 Tax=Streptomyces sp. enrichment culture TaxID=1795815 RepID=UPI003F54AADE